LPATVYPVGTADVPLTEKEEPLLESNGSLGMEARYLDERQAGTQQEQRVLGSQI